MIPVTSAGRRRGVLLVLAAALLALAVVVAVLVRSSGRGGPAVAKVVGAPGPKSTASHSRSSAPPQRPVPSRTPHPVPHEFVAAAAPTSFTYRAPKYTIRAQVCGMEYIRPLDPPGEQHHTVCWVQHDFGFAPGSKGRGTTYLLGHAWAEDPQEVLNKLSEAAMRQVLPLLAHNRSRLVSGIPVYPVTRLNGDRITLRTSAGVLGYTVRDTYAVGKAVAGNVAALMNAHTRNRVVIITCGELNGVDYDYNIIVDAYLTSSEALGRTT